MAKTRPAVDSDLDSNNFANIMLDLECTDAYIDNPAIIQLGAVYFNLDTGRIISELDISLNLDSCVAAGLKITRKGMEWLEDNIPECLEKSRTSETTLRQALQELNKFVKNAIVHARLRQGKGKCKVRPQPMIWGNGALADNLWIRSAYRACKMERPWKYYNDMCLRTVVKQFQVITGEQYFWNSITKTGLPRLATEPVHDALSDCKYQVRYLVAARCAIMKLKAGARAVDETPETILKESGKERDDISTSAVIEKREGKDEAKAPKSDNARWRRAQTGSTSAVSKRRNARAQIRHGLQTPETSFSGPQDIGGILLPALITPDTSFSELQPSIKVAHTASTTSLLRQEAEGLTDWSSADITYPYIKDEKSYQTISAEASLPTPDVSFCVSNDDDTIDNKCLFPPSPSTDYGDLEADDFDELEASITRVLIVQESKRSQGDRYVKRQIPGPSQ